MIEMGGGQKFLKTCLRGDEIVAHSFWGVLKNSLWIYSKLQISFEGIKIFSFFALGGSKKKLLALRGGLKIFVILIWIRPPPYCWVTNEQPLNSQVDGAAYHTCLKISWMKVNTFAIFRHPICLNVFCRMYKFSGGSLFPLHMDCVFELYKEVSSF